MTPAARIAALLDAARRVFGAARSAALVAALAEESGLHPSNVRRALDRSLEISPDPAQLETLLARAPSHDAVLVLLAANVFVAPLRALCWALAQSERVRVRTSRRASVFTDALLAACTVPIARLPSGEPEDALASLRDDEIVHAYGGRAAMEAISGVARTRELHGPGFGVIVAAGSAIEAAADAIAEDVALFDQRGCLSPRLVLSIGDVDPSRLHQALGALDASMPRGALTEGERSELARTRDAALMAGDVLEGTGHLVIASATPFVGPTGRVVPITRVASLEEAVTIVRSLGDGLSTLGTEPTLGRALAEAFPRARIALLGAMQSPPLDGPVDLRARAGP